MSFIDRVVIVTGASSGIGAAIAISFSQQGAKVVIVGRNEAKLKHVSDTCASSHKKSEQLVVKADVAVEDDAKRIIDETLKRFGKIDILINNAGIVRFGSLLDGTLMQSYDEVMKTNLRAVFHLTSLVTPHLVKTKGNIVNISSVAGSLPPFAPWLTYCASKAALDHFTKGAASELAPRGVRVNAISPGPVKTDIIDNAGIDASYDDWAAMTPLGRSSDSQEIADLALYIASDKARGITGSIILADNGMFLKRV